MPTGVRIAVAIAAGTVLTAIARSLPGAIRAFQDRRSNIIRARGAARAEVIRAKTARLRARTMRRCTRRVLRPDHTVMRCLLIDQAITGEHSPGSGALERLLGLLAPGPETAQGDGPRPAGDVSNIRSMQGRDTAPWPGPG